MTVPSFSHPKTHPIYSITPIEARDRQGWSILSIDIQSFNNTSFVIRNRIESTVFTDKNEAIFSVQERAALEGRVYVERSDSPTIIGPFLAIQQVQSKYFPVRTRLIEEEASGYRVEMRPIFLSLPDAQRQGYDSFSLACQVAQLVVQRSPCPFEPHFFLASQGMHK